MSKSFSCCINFGYVALEVTIYLFPVYSDQGFQGIPCGSIGFLRVFRSKLYYRVIQYLRKQNFGLF